MIRAGGTPPHPITVQEAGCGALVKGARWFGFAPAEASGVEASVVSNPFEARRFDPLDVLTPAVSF